MTDVPETHATGRLRHWVEATVTRADGTTEDLGVIATDDSDGPGTVTVEEQETER